MTLEKRQSRLPTVDFRAVNGHFFACGAPKNIVENQKTDYEKTLLRHRLGASESPKSSGQRVTPRQSPPRRELRRPRPLPYTPSYPPCASGRHGARSAPQGLSYTTRRQRGWMTPFAAIFRAMRRRVFTRRPTWQAAPRQCQRRPESSCRRVTRRSNLA